MRSKFKSTETKAIVLQHYGFNGFNKGAAERVEHAKNLRASLAYVYPFATVGDACFLAIL